jgi:molybdenum cofactor cytidylyltransferase
VKKVSAILLSAGLGSRTGTFKPLMPWKNESFILKTWRSLREAQVFKDIVVVSGHQANLIGLQLPFAQVVRNDDYATGMMSSIQCGLKAVMDSVDAVLFAHVDQPHLEGEDYHKLYYAFQNCNRNLFRPVFQNEPGNPAIIGKKYFAEIMQQPPQDSGCSFLFKKYSIDVFPFDAKDGRFNIDFDTPESLNQYANGNLPKNT